jgi:hypothetical protein
MTFKVVVDVKCIISKREIKWIAQIIIIRDEKERKKIS